LLLLSGAAMTTWMFNLFSLVDMGLVLAHGLCFPEDGQARAQAWGSEGHALGLGSWLVSHMSKSLAKHGVSWWFVWASE
jgi:hypothetical protein